MSFLGFKKYIALAALLAFCMLIFSTCKKPESPEPVNMVGDPVFSLTGNCDSAIIKLMAGVDTYYMYSSYGHDSSVFSLTGTLKQAKCSTCQNSIKITIFDSVARPLTSPVDIQLALQKTSYDYYFPKVITTYQMSFIAHDSGFISPTYKWDFGNGQFATTKNATGIFTDTVTRNICLTVKDASDSSTFCNFVKPIDSGSAADSCRTDFSFSVDSALKKGLFINGSFPPSGLYFWDFGDGKDTTVPGSYSPSHSYSLPGTYKVCLLQASGACSRKLCKNVVINDPAFQSLADFIYVNPSVSSATTPRFSKIIITYIDKDGQEFGSDVKEQPAGSFFNLISHQAYKNNEVGQKTEKLVIRFNCNVFSKTGVAVKNLNITSGVIAIAYP